MNPGYGDVNGVGDRDGDDDGGQVITMIIMR